MYRPNPFVGGLVKTCRSKGETKDVSTVLFEDVYDKHRVGR